MGRDQPHSIDVTENDSCPQVRFERELVVGSVGTMWLGRLTAGTEAGRVVMLRRLGGELLTPKEIAALTKIGEAYAKVRHPSLVKLLGVVEQDRDVICISEHLDGVRLHDLLRNAMDRDAPLPATVAVRIILDAARATVKAHRLAAELGLFPSTRLFVPDGIFIAAFGGTLLTEVGVLGAISRAEQPRTFPDLIAQLSPEEFQKAAPQSGSPEVFSLGVLLWEALANRPLFSKDSRQRTLHELATLTIDNLNHVERYGMPVPDSLAEVVRVATLRRTSERYQSVDAFVAALEQLPAHFVANEHQVASALREQACDLMQQYQVDPSQSSLTLAFSKVHSGRASTCPPPSDSQRWDVPTLAQSRLLASIPALQVPTLTDIEQLDALPPVMLRQETDALGTFATGQSSLGSATKDHLAAPNAAEASSVKQQHSNGGKPRRALKWFAWCALALAALAGVTAFATRATLSRSRWSPSAATPDPLQRPTIAKTIAKPKPEVSANPTSDAAAISFPTDVVHPAAESTNGANAHAANPTKLKQAGPGSIPSSGVYRPRQISTYRPKGI